MAKVTFIRTDGTKVDCEATVGENLMNVAMNNFVDEILAECGGSLSCATCHVYLTDEWLSKISPPGEMEKSMLELVEDPRSGSRLSCQIEISDKMDGLTLELPSTQY